MGTNSTTRMYMRRPQITSKPSSLSRSDFLKLTLLDKGQLESWRIGGAVD